jgi:hypothetical protein
MYKWENINIDIEGIRSEGIGLDSTSSGWGPVAGYCEELMYLRVS